MGLSDVQGKTGQQLKAKIVYPNGITIEPYSQILLFIGRKMSGKSYAAKYYTSHIKRIIVWDYNWEHADKVIVHDIASLESAWYSREMPKRIAFQPLNKGVADFDVFCNWIVNHVRYCNVEVEELFQVANTATIANPKLNLGFKTIVGSGRHKMYNLGLTCTERRLQGLPAMITGNTDHFFIFKQQKKEDWDLMESYAEQSKVDELKQAPKHHYIYVGYDDIHEGNAILMPPVGKATPTRNVRLQNERLQTSKP